MGRSFDRGGQSRKEREKGKRRAYRQAERNREALEAVVHAKRRGTVEYFPVKTKAPRVAAATTVVAVTPRLQQVAPPVERPVAIIEQKPAGFISKFFSMFKKAA
jgi:hypothetical protein